MSDLKNRSLDFQKALLQWFRKEARALPWRETKEPYAIWISEMMCQQTGVQTVIAYYQKFLKRFPRLEDLAASSEEEVLRLWEGLGYYSRAKNMRRAAQLLVHERGGEWPQTREEILKLPGIGAYSAGAILAIAFDKREAALDGNVIRVLTRLTGDREAVDQGQKIKELWVLAEALVPEASQHRRDYTEAMMELGATICQPRKADCIKCPVSQFCASAGREDRLEIPVKSKRISRVKLAEEVFFLARGNKIGLFSVGSDKKYPAFRRLPFQTQALLSERKPDFRYSVTNRDFSVYLSRKLPKSLAKKVEWVSKSELEECLLPAIDRKIIRAQEL